MKATVVVGHILIGLFLCLTQLTTLATLLLKVHAPGSYYSPTELSNQGIIDHIAALKRDQFRLLAVEGFSIAVGVASIAAAAALLQGKSWPRTVLPVTTLTLSVLSLYSGRSQAALAQSAYVAAALILGGFFLIEARFLWRNQETNGRG